ncbi:MAG TPA: hypothetical protein VK116_13075 [Planctomycetota bacterium]|nr:hypothetical protein [Planctomycetota bacterium]
MLIPLASLGCVTQHGPIPWEIWRDTYPPDYGMPLEEKEERLLAHLESRHLSPEGMLLYVRPNAPFDPNEPGSYVNLSDVPIWTGTYAGALAFRYGVTSRPEDRNRLLQVLAGIEFLHDVTGVPGLLARAAMPRRLSPPGADGGEWRPAPPPFSDWAYRGDVSRDQYFGVLFGYAAACVVLGIDATQGDEEIRTALRPTAEAIANHFWENGFRIVDADGEPTEHGDLRGYVWGFPLGPNAGLVLGFQLVAWRLSGNPVYRERYDELIEERWHEALFSIKFELPGWINHNNDNMGMMALYALANLEPEPEIQEVYDRAIAKLWNYVRYEGNAFWHLVYASRFELPREAIFDLRENLKLYPLDTVIRSYDWTDVYADRLDLACFPDRFGRPHNRTALPMHLRRRGDFVWKNSPFAARHTIDGLEGAASGSGFDFLLAYWMARHTLGDPEQLVEG